MYRIVRFNLSCRGAEKEKIDRKFTIDSIVNLLFLDKKKDFHTRRLDKNKWSVDEHNDFIGQIATHLYLYHTQCDAQIRDEVRDLISHFEKCE